MATRLSLVKTILNGAPLAATTRWAKPPTISRRSASISISHNSVKGKLCIRVKKPLISSGVYVEPPPITVTFMFIYSPCIDCSLDLFTRNHLKNTLACHTCPEPQVLGFERSEKSSCQLKDFPWHLPPGQVSVAGERSFEMTFLR